MATIDQQIDEILTEIRKTPYHKGTERHIGILKAKVAKLKAKREAAASRGSSGKGISYAIKKQGDATVVLVGPPSAGKSTLLNKLTNARSKVAPYAFTTVSVIPGMMKYRDTDIQILDVPGLIEGAETGKGRGREVLSVVRAADLLILISDIKRPEAIARISESLESNGIRINKEPPKIFIEKTTTGGLEIKTNIKQELSRETIKEVAREMGIKNGEITIEEKLTTGNLVDAFSGNRVYVPALNVINKSDLIKQSTKFGFNAILISAERGIGIDKLRAQIWKKLNLVRVYLIKPDDNPNFNDPMVVKKDWTLKMVSQKIGNEFAENKTRAKIWGPGAKFPEQEVSLNTKVKDGMQIRYI